MFYPGIIGIGMDPLLINAGPFIISWHGLFTFIAVAAAVALTVYWGRKDGMSADAVYSVALWCIIGGIIGARVVHVIDFWGPCDDPLIRCYADNPMDVFKVWEGGIAIYGAIIGGFFGGAIYIKARNSDWFLGAWGRYFRFLGEPDRAPLPGVGHLADVAAPALLIAMAIGRIGDVINGEHFARASDLPWAFAYTHPNSPGYNQPASHPAVLYEMLFDLALAAAIWPFRDRLRPRGMFFVMYGALYSVGRFFLSFLRLEANEYFGVFNQAQVLALIVILIAVPLLVYKAQFIRPSQRTESGAGQI